jgi:hypothetical protein
MHAVVQRLSPPQAPAGSRVALAACQWVVGAGLGLAIACAALFDRALKASKQERKKERKKENRDTAHANAPTPEITRCLTGRNPKGPPSEAPRAPAPPPPPPIFDALVRCATTSLRYVRWRGATSPTRDSSFFTAYAATLPLRGVSEPPPRSPNQRVDASSARRVGALLLLRLRTARSRSAPPCINLV